MPASLLHFILVQHGVASHPARPRTLRLHVDAQARPPAEVPAHLLVLDSRRMNPACLKAAFAEIRRLRETPGFRHGVLVCDVPALATVQSAIRAGLNDIIQEPLTARQLAGLLRATNPGRRACADQLSALAAIVRTVAASDGPAPAPSTILARREYELVQRAERLAHKETRLALERAALEERERQLRAGARRLDREFAALQQDADLARPSPPPPASETTASPFGATVSPFSAHPFAPDLQNLAAQLAERARALDIRERMLHEMETLLAAQFAPPAAPAATRLPQTKV